MHIGRETHMYLNMFMHAHMCLYYVIRERERYIYIYIHM